jgi:hypothetical protein
MLYLCYGESCSEISPPLDPILIHINPHPSTTFPQYAILILSPSQQCGLCPSDFPSKVLCCRHSYRRCACYISRPSRPWYEHPNNVCWALIMALIIQFPPASCHFISFRSRDLLSPLFSNTLNLRSSVNVKDQVSQPYKITSRTV